MDEVDILLVKESIFKDNNQRADLLREELIVRNLRLVPYVAWKIALRHNIDREELDTYGYMYKKG